MDHTLHIKYALLTELLRSLEEEGVVLGLDKHLDILELVKKIPDDTTIHQLKEIITPAIATNQQEQELVYYLFDRSLERVNAYFEFAKESQIGTKSNWLIPSIFLVILTIIPLAFYLWFPKSVVGPNERRKPFTIQQDTSIQICLKREDLSDLEGEIQTAKFAENTRLSSFCTYEFTEEFCLNFTSFEQLGTDSITAYLFNSVGDSAIVHFIPTIIKRATLPEALDQVNDDSSIEKYLFNYKDYPFASDLSSLAVQPLPSWQKFYIANSWWLKLVLITLTGLLIFLVLLLRRNRRKKLIAEIENNNNPPFVFRIQSQDKIEIEIEAILGTLAKNMRRRTNSGQQNINIGSTIKATIRKGGMIDFRYSSSTRLPEYLVLIEQQNSDDHHVELYNHLYQYFRENEVLIERFYFGSDIRLCWNEKYTNGVQLRSLYQLYPETNLIIIGAGYQLLSPLTGRIAEWTKVFSQWRNKAVLTSVPHLEWGRREEEIKRKFGLVPATLQGLAFTIDQMDSSVNPDFNSWGKTVHDSSAISISLETNAVNELSLYYPPKLLLWIASCAVYPNLHWDLTLQLGELLSTENDSLLSVSNITQINRLNWFREGMIPAKARTNLINWLEKRNQKLLQEVRSTIDSILRKNPPPMESTAYEDYLMQRNLNEWLICTDSKQKKRLEQEITNQLEAGIEPDITIIKYLNRSQTPLDFLVPKKWRKYVYNGGYKGLGLKDISKDLLWALPAWFFLIGLTWWIQPEINQCSNIVTVYKYEKIQNLPDRSESKPSFNIYSSLADLPENWKRKDSLVVFTNNPEDIETINNAYVSTHISRDSFTGETKVSFTEQRINYSRDTIVICNDSPEKQLIINQHLTSGAIVAENFEFADSMIQATQQIYRSVSSSIIMDSLFDIYQQNVSIDYWNKAVKFYQNAEDDIDNQYGTYITNQEQACLLFRKSYEVLDSLTPLHNQALAWCNKEVIANFSPNTDQCCLPCTITFSNYSSEAVGYIWDFGDGMVSQEKEPDHTFSEAGEYEVSLVALGASGKRDTVTRTIAMLGDFSPIISIPEGPQQTGEPIKFSVTTNHESVFWDFGDGSVSNDKDPTHIFTEAGSYAILLILGDRCGEDRSSFMVQVNGIPPPVFDPINPLESDELREVNPPSRDSIFKDLVPLDSKDDEDIPSGKVIRLRCMWRDDPATTMVIGWDQITGRDPILYYGEKDMARNFSGYPYSQKPDRIQDAKGMRNHFVRLQNLKPNTRYYFVIKSGSNVSLSFSFQTAPNSPSEKLSIIAGGDSRNHREARRNANILVGKMRPHCVMFGGDMTADDGGNSWKQWLDDWQYTMGTKRQLIPIITARGNHEASNQSIVDLFDVPSPEVYYGLNLGGNLLRIYTLNTLIPSGGNQKNWLESDLKKHQQTTWRFAQYHHTMRPHTSSKPEKDELILNWATLFHKYEVDLVVESDAHVAKWTYPIRPSRAAGSAEGFIRDDARGTVYVGEGGWGAPLRINDDDKPWTRASGKFNQFNWILVTQNSVEIRKVITECAPYVQQWQEGNRYNTLMQGLRLWNPPTGSIVTLKSKKVSPSPPGIGTLRPGTNGLVNISFTLKQTANVEAVLTDKELRQLATVKYDGLPAGPNTKSLNVANVPPGEYIILIKANGSVIQRYALIK